MAAERKKPVNKIELEEQAGVILEVRPDVLKLKSGVGKVLLDIDKAHQRAAKSKLRFGIPVCSF